MLTSIANVQAEMLKQLTRGGTGTNDVLTIPGIVDEAGVAQTVPVNYARKSQKTLKEANREIYPSASVWDYGPEINKTWMPNHQKSYDGFHDFTVPNPVAGGPLLPAKAYEFEDPFYLTFRYDLSFYVSSPMSRFYLYDYVLKTFSPRGQFILNAVTLPSGDVVGDVAGYTMTTAEVPRTDGIFELNCEFVSNLMVLIKDPQEVDLITNFNTTITPTI